MDVKVLNNPCPCGYYPDKSKCHCTESQIRHYQRGISKPILERIDLCVEASPISFQEATSRDSTVSSKELRKRVQEARLLQRIRFMSHKHLHVNADMGAKDIEHFCKLSDECRNFIEKIFELKSMSMRTFHKVLKVARTIADLDDSAEISIAHLSEAVSYRGLEDHLYGTREMSHSHMNMNSLRMAGSLDTYTKKESCNAVSARRHDDKPMSGKAVGIV